MINQSDKNIKVMQTFRAQAIQLRYHDLFFVCDSIILSTELELEEFIDRQQILLITNAVFRTAAYEQDLKEPISWRTT